MQMNIRTGQDSVEDAISDTIERCEQSQPTLNAFVRIDREGALAAARVIDANGASAAPLAGVPVSVKDILNVANGNPREVIDTAAVGEFAAHLVRGEGAPFAFGGGFGLLFDAHRQAANRQ